MKWRNEYNIGVSIIDQQHKKMAVTITALQNALTTTYVNQQMGKTLKFLVDYSIHHFHEEEEIMQTIGFPSFKLHQQMHKSLVHDVKQILIKLKNKKTIRAGDMIDFLVEWLTKHILEEDQKIGAHIQNMKNKGNTLKKSTPASERQKLIRKLTELKTMFEKELISKQDGSNKKSYLIVDFIELQLVDTKPALMENFDFLRSLLDKNLINEAELKTFQQQLANKINLKDILDTIKENSEKIETLNVLVEGDLISQEKYQIFKEQLLDAL